MKSKGPFVQNTEEAVRRFMLITERLDDAGANGLVLFNRFLQPDLDIENLEVVTNMVLSDSSELRLPLRWVAILYGHINSSLAITRGIHTHEDLIKAVMAGADVTQMTSVLLREGVGKIKTLLDKVSEFVGFDDIDFESAEFSRKFYVKSHDKRWAYDIIHPLMMEYLLAMPVFTIQFDLNRIMAHRDKVFSIADFERAIDLVEGIIQRFPDYLVKQQIENPYP